MNSREESKRSKLGQRTAKVPQDAGSQSNASAEVLRRQILGQRTAGSIGGSKLGK